MHCFEDEWVSDACSAVSIRVGPGEDKPARLALSLLAQPSYSYGAIA